MRDPTVVAGVSAEVPSALNAFVLGDTAVTYFNATIVGDAILVELRRPIGTSHTQPWGHWHWREGQYRFENSRYEEKDLLSLAYISSLRINVGGW